MGHGIGTRTRAIGSRLAGESWVVVVVGRRTELVEVFHGWVKDLGVVLVAVHDGEDLDKKKRERDAMG